MKAIKMCSVFLLCSLIIGLNSSYAEQDSLSGKIGLGIILINGGNNLNPQESKKRIYNLTTAADKERTVLPMVLPQVTYDVGEDEGLKLYFGTEPPIDEVGGFAFNLGGTYPITGLGTVDVSSFFTPFVEAWKNPYETDIARQKTNTSKYGAKIAINRIMGTGLRVNVVYMNDDVDDDVIGLLEPEMARDGAVFSLNANYSFYFSPDFELRPRVSFRTGDYDGEANSFKKYKFDLEARYRVGRLMFIPRGHYSHSDYDEVNPIFGETRDNNSYGVSLMSNYMAPFGWQDWSVMGLVSLSKGDSNIDFYDTEAVTLGAFMSYQF